MSFDAIRTASVIRYPYLWAREADRGETEGRKSRPIAVGFRLREPDGNDLLVLLPITSQPPVAGRIAVEIPEMEKRRGGLDTALRLWIILDEYNQDVLTKSYYLEPEPPLGEFSKAFFAPIMLRLIRHRRAMRGVDRQA